MILDFLSVAAGGPAARGPIADRSFAGAELERRGTWDVVGSYGDAEGEARACRESVGWVDLSHLAKAELHGPADLLGALEPGLAERRGDGWVCPITPRRALLLGDADGSSAAATVDLTSSLAAISIAGPAARETIARFCALDTRATRLAVGGFRPGSIGRTPGYLLREAEERFLLLFGAAFGVYMWDVVADAGSRLGGRPVGVAAIESGSVRPGREVIADA